MTTSTDTQRDDQRLTAALRLVIRQYAATTAAPARGRTGRAAAAGRWPTCSPSTLPRSWSPGCSAPSRRASPSRLPEFAPYVATFAALWLSGQIAWRLAVVLIARVEIRGMEGLYIEAMDELLAKDLAFFQNNYAGSLTKRALGYARRFEDVFDVLSFQVGPTLLPLAFVGSRAVVVLSVAHRAARWPCSLTTFVMVVPLIRRRRRLVDVREAASNVLAGHVADSITNAEAVRAFAREPDEARIHADNVGDLRREDAAIVGLPEPARRSRDVAHVRRHQHARAHPGAVGRAARRARASKWCSSRSATTPPRRA